MITIDLIRHAESNMNVDMANPQREPFIGGRQNEVELSPLGKRQSIQLGNYAVARNIRPTHIYSSPAVRTIQTGLISGEVMAHGLDMTIDDGLQELDQGEWTNQPRALYKEPLNMAAMDRLKGDFAPAGGESMNDVNARIDERLSEIALSLADANAHVWVFTHGVAIKTWIGNKLGWPHEQIYTTAIDNASLTRVVGDGTDWSVVFINHSSQVESD